MGGGKAVVAMDGVAAVVVAWEMGGVVEAKEDTERAGVSKVAVVAAEGKRVEQVVVGREEEAALAVQKEVGRGEGVVMAELTAETDSQVERVVGCGGAMGGMGVEKGKKEPSRHRQQTGRRAPSCCSKIRKSEAVSEMSLQM